jgi:hypothetical protein
VGDPKGSNLEGLTHKTKTKRTIVEMSKKKTKKRPLRAHPIRNQQKYMKKGKKRTRNIPNRYTKKIKKTDKQTESNKKEFPQKH